MNIFWDTSAVLALVLKDKHGKSAAGQALRTDVHHVTTPLVVLEAENKLNALVWQTGITRKAGACTMVALERFFVSRLITVRNVKEARLIAAEGRPPPCARTRNSRCATSSAAASTSRWGNA